MILNKFGSKSDQVRICMWKKKHIVGKKEQDMSVLFARARGKLDRKLLLKLTWGGSHNDLVYVYVPAFWGAFSWNLV